MYATPLLTRHGNAPSSFAPLSALVGGRFAALYEMGVDKENSGRGVEALDVFLDLVDVNTSDKGMKMEVSERAAHALENNYVLKARRGESTGS